MSGSGPKLRAQKLMVDQIASYCFEIMEAERKGGWQVRGWRESQIPPAGCAPVHIRNQILLSITKIISIYQEVLRNDGQVFK